MVRSSAVIFDLDGTLSDVGHRVHHMRTKPKNWQAFHDACVSDPCNDYLVELARALQYQYLIIILTSRPASHFNQTVEWLEKNQIPCWELLMRPTKDHRPDYEYKCEMLAHIRQKYRVVFAVDDRPTVVKMWRANGIPCLVPDDSSWYDENGVCYDHPNHR